MTKTKAVVLYRQISEVAHRHYRSQRPTLDGGRGPQGVGCEHQEAGVARAILDGGYARSSY